MIRYNSQAVNPAFIVHTYILTCLDVLYIYTYIFARFYLLLLLLCFSIPSKRFNLFTLNFLHTILFRITRKITYSKKLHSLKTSARSLFGLFWVLILVMLLHILRAVQYFLIKVCIDVFLYYSNIFYCTKHFFHSMSPFSWGHLFTFRYFFLFLDNFLFSYKILYLCYS